MCFVDAHTKNNSSEHDDIISGGGYPIPSNSTTEALVSLSATIDFIGFGVQCLERNFLDRYNMYFGTMKKNLKIPVKLPKPPSTK